MMNSLIHVIYDSSFLNNLNGVINILTGLSIATYTKNGFNRYRFFISAIAYVLTISCIWSGIQYLLYIPADQPITISSLAINIVFCILVIFNGGNIAQLLRGINYDFSK